MSSSSNIAANWLASTGFLTGTLPSLSPENPYRVSTNILPVYPPLGWQFQATGALYPGAELTWQGGMASYPSENRGVAMFDLSNYASVSGANGNATDKFSCKASCTMGGCADPTSHAHPYCVAAGCCACAGPEEVHAKSGNNACVPFQQSGWQETPLLPMDTISNVSTDCTPGSKEYCQSYLNYFNCNPSTLLSPDTDPRCAGFKPDAVPW